MIVGTTGQKDMHPPPQQVLRIQWRSIRAPNSSGAAAFNIRAVRATNLVRLVESRDE
jgi:hypothetical protein